MKRKCNLAILRTFIDSVVKIEKKWGKTHLIHFITNRFEIEMPNGCGPKGSWHVLSSCRCGGAQWHRRGPQPVLDKSAEGERASLALIAVSL